jgi:hypothetical protein
MEDFFCALEYCFDAIDLGIDLESCLSLYPEYEEQLREFFQRWDGTREIVEVIPELTFEQVPFDQALDECIKAVGNGESPASCYKRYPFYARKMRPWLDAVSDLSGLRREDLLQSNTIFDDFIVPDVPFTQALQEYIQAYRKKEPSVVLARYPFYADRLQFWADKIPKQPELIPSSSQPLMINRLSSWVGGVLSNLSLQMPVAAGLALLLFLFSGFGLVRTAATTIPGDSLYPVKLIAEQIHLNIVPEDQKIVLKTQFAEERRQETSVLIQADIKQDVAFDGVITSIDKNKMTVSNVVILLNGFDSNVPVFTKGERVHIEGYTGRIGVVVKRVDVHLSDGTNRTFVASTPSLPPSLLLMALSPTPIFEAQGSPPPLFGANIITIKPTKTIKVTPQSNPSYPPTSVPTNIPTPVPTSVATNIPPPVPTSVPTNIPTPVPTSVPTNIPTPVPTSVPTNIPTPVPTSVPTTIPTPVPTSVPTDVPTSEPTSAPTDVPTPEPTSVPTDVPPPEPTSVPTDVPTPEVAPQSAVTAQPTNSIP